MKVRNFRASHRESIPEKYNGWAHLMALLVSSIVIMAALLPFINFGLAEFLMVPIAFLISNFIEYLDHRWPMHRKFLGFTKPYKKHAGMHHVFFTDKNMIADSHKDFIQIIISSRALFGIFFIAGITSLSIWALSTVSLASTFLFVAIGYYCLTEFLHTSFHHEKIREWPIIKKLRNLHTVHHNTKLMKDYNFNIAFPIFDFVFGTYHK